MELSEARQILFDMRQEGKISFKTLAEFNQILANIDCLYREMVKSYATTRQSTVKRKFNELQDSYYTAMTLVEEQIFWYQMGGCDEVC